jgi:hypothetical protein
MERIVKLNRGLLELQVDHLRSCHEIVEAALRRHDGRVEEWYEEQRMLLDDDEDREDQVNLRAMPFVLQRGVRRRQEGIQASDREVRNTEACRCEDLLEPWHKDSDEFYHRKAFLGREERARYDTVLTT